MFVYSYLVKIDEKYKTNMYTFLWNEEFFYQKLWLLINIYRLKSQLYVFIVE